MARLTAMRTMTYSQAQNRRDAVASANCGSAPRTLKWYRLDDGIESVSSSPFHAVGARPTPSVGVHTGVMGGDRRRNTTEGGALTAGMLDKGEAASHLLERTSPAGCERRSARAFAATARRNITVERARWRPVVEQPVLAARPAHEARRGAVRRPTSRKIRAVLRRPAQPLPRGLIESQRHGPGRLHALFVSQRRLAEPGKNLRAEGHRINLPIRNSRRRGDLS